jgi:hypothetical protein
LDAAWRADFNAQRLTLCNGSLNIHTARSLRWAKRFRDWRPPSLDCGKGRRADRRRVECLLNFIMSASDQAAITYYSTVAERQQKTAKLRASCGSSGIEIRVSPRVISGGFFFATAARGLSTIAATRAGQSQGQATKVAMLGSRDYVTR